jgi:arylformamidase
MIYDISQEVFSCRVWPGDPSPERSVLADIGKGDIINLTAFSMCAHNGTHVDAPAHFLKDGKTIEQLDPAAFVGDCYVARHEGEVTAADAAAILQKAAAVGASERILIGGKATVTEAAARVFAEAGILLIGNESQTVGPENAPMAVHLILLGADIVLLEGLVLSHVPAGKYFLTAAPIHLGGCEGAPCRAMLMKNE